MLITESQIRKIIKEEVDDLLGKTRPMRRDYKLQIMTHLEEAIKKMLEHYSLISAGDETMGIQNKETRKARLIEYRKIVQKFLAMREEFNKFFQREQYEPQAPEKQ